MTARWWHAVLLLAVGYVLGAMFPSLYTKAKSML